MAEYVFVPESILERNAEKLKKLQEYVKTNMIQRRYHNYRHAEEAANAYFIFGEREGLSPGDIFLGMSAMTAHDLITIPGANDNEERTIDKVQEILPSFGYFPAEIEQISKIIYATKVGVEPTNLLEKLAKDSDLDMLGRDVFFERSEALRQEWGVESVAEWNEWVLNNIMRYRYHTNAAKEIRYKGFEKNKYLLSKMVEEARASEVNHEFSGGLVTN